MITKKESGMKNLNLTPEQYDEFRLIMDSPLSKWDDHLRQQVEAFLQFGFRHYADKDIYNYLANVTSDIEDIVADWVRDIH